MEASRKGKSWPKDDSKAGLLGKEPSGEKTGFSEEQWRKLERVVNLRELHPTDSDHWRPGQALALILSVTRVLTWTDKDPGEPCRTGITGRVLTGRLLSYTGGHDEEVALERVWGAAEPSAAELLELLDGLALGQSGKMRLRVAPELWT